LIIGLEPYYASKFNLYNLKIDFKTAKNARAKNNALEASLVLVRKAGGLMF
jgi:hypothetical protein